MRILLCLPLLASGCMGTAGFTIDPGPAEIHHYHGGAQFGPPELRSDRVRPAPNARDTEPPRIVGLIRVTSGPTLER